MLVEKYKELRTDDAQGGIGRNSYRITVRQLESLIRLSEAIAKACCLSEITPDFVREAFNLLRQSIISVEKDDVIVEEGDGDVDGASADGDGDGDGNDDGDCHSPMLEDHDNQLGRAGPSSSSNARARSQTPGQAKEKTKITYDKYMSILNLIVKRVNSDQMAMEDGVEENELLTWYLEQKESELESQEDLVKERDLARKVLKRMVKVFISGQ